MVAGVQRGRAGAAAVRWWSVAPRDFKTQLVEKGTCHRNFSTHSKNYAEIYNIYFLVAHVSFVVSKTAGDRLVGSCERPPHHPSSPHV